MERRTPCPFASDIRCRRGSASWQDNRRRRRCWNWLSELSASAYHFDVLLGERHPLLAAEQRQQNQHALVRPHTGKEPKVPGEESSHNPYLVTGLRTVGGRKLDGTAAFAAADFFGNRIAQPGWFTAGHDPRSHANGPTHIPPAPIPEGNESIRRK